jgi:hypothetical protein
MPKSASPTSTAGSTCRQSSEADLDETALAYHADLERGRLRVRSPRTQGVTLQRYLNEKTSTRRKSYGFSLGLDKWKIAGKDVESLKKVDRRDVDGRIQRSYQGLRGYQGKWISRSWSWEVDFSAAMPSFSAAPGKPRVSEFACGLGVLWHQDGKKLTSDDVDELLDTASLWRIVDEAGLAPARRLLKGCEGKPYEATVQLLLGTGTFWDIRALLADPTRPALRAAGAWRPSCPEEGPSLHAGAAPGGFRAAMGPPPRPSGHHPGVPAAPGQTAA